MSGIFDFYHHVFYVYDNSMCEELALQLYRNTEMKSAKLQVAMEQIGFQQACNEDEYSQLLAKPMLDRADVPEIFDRLVLKI